MVYVLFEEFQTLIPLYLTIKLHVCNPGRRDIKFRVKTINGRPPVNDIINVRDPVSISRHFTPIISEYLYL